MHTDYFKDHDHNFYTVSAFPSVFVCYVLIFNQLWIFVGYLDNEHATSSTVDEDGWLRTGDIAYFDQDGYLYILDRLKDTIKYKGFQVSRNNQVTDFY